MSVKNTTSKKERLAAQQAAFVCLEIVTRHLPLTDGERGLLEAIQNQIRVTFDLPGAVKPEETIGNLISAPPEWFW